MIAIEARGGEGGRVGRREFKIGERKLVMLSAEPVNRESLVPIIYLAGFRPSFKSKLPREEYDIQHIANAAGSRVITFVFEDNAPTDVRPARGYPRGVKMPNLYEEKAVDIQIALNQLVKEGSLLGTQPLDLIGYSDGNGVVKALLHRNPHGFKFVQLDNPIGEDRKGSLRVAAKAGLELVQIGGKSGFRLARRIVGLEQKKEKLSSTEKAQHKVKLWRRFVQLQAEARAIGKARLHGLFVDLLKQNGDLRFLVLNTERDFISQLRRTRRAIGRALEPGETRVRFGTTNWDQHIMDTDLRIRKLRLADMGRWMKEMRQSSW